MPGQKTVPRVFRSTVAKAQCRRHRDSIRPIKTIARRIGKPICPHTESPWLRVLEFCAKEEVLLESTSPGLKLNVASIRRQLNDRRCPLARKASAAGLAIARRRVEARETRAARPRRG